MSQGKIKNGGQDEKKMERTKNYDILLFDLDGTLLDTGKGITASVRYAIKKQHILIKDETELYRFIGPPLIESFMTFYEMSRENAERALIDYRTCYFGGAMYENKPYDGMTETLERLQKAGKTLMVATSKPEPLAEKILEYHDMKSYFSFIVGAKMDETRTTKAEVIEYLLRENGFDSAEKEKTLMIGDRKYDVIGANAVAIDCMGVLYGYGDKKELLDAGAACIVRTPTEIADVILSDKK